MKQDSIDAPRLKAAHVEEVPLERVENPLVCRTESAFPVLFGAGKPPLRHLSEMSQCMSQRALRKRVGRRRRAKPLQERVGNGAIDIGGASASARCRVTTEPCEEAEVATPGEMRIPEANQLARNAVDHLHERADPHPAGYLNVDSSIVTFPYARREEGTLCDACGAFSRAHGSPAWLTAHKRARRINGSCRKTSRTISHQTVDALTAIHRLRGDEDTDAWRQTQHEGRESSSASTSRRSDAPSIDSLTRRISPERKTTSTRSEGIGRTSTNTGGATSREGEVSSLRRQL